MAPPKKKYVSVSFVWKYFEKKTSISAQCKLCGEVKSSCGNTSNYRKHLSIRHHIREKTSKPSEEEEDADDNIRPTTEDLTQQDSSNSYSENPFFGTGNKVPSLISKPTSTFGEHTPRRNKRPASESGNTSSGPRPEKQFQPSSLSPKNIPINDFFNKINSYKDGGERNQAITNAIIYWIVKDMLSFHEVENEGFLYLMKILAPHYKVPSASTVSYLIEKRYQLVMPIVQDRFKKASDVNITSDAWTETMNHQSFLSLTTHFIENDSLVSFPIGIEPLSENHTGEYLGKILKNLCSKWEIVDEKVIACVTDNASNISKGISDYFGKSKHLPCCAHTVQLIPKSLFEHAQICPLLQKGKRIIKLFKDSMPAADALRKAQKTERPLKLINSTETRWNSTYYSLERFLVLIGVVNNILLNYPHIEAITGSEVEIFKDLIVLLKPFEELTRKVSGDKYFTSSRIIPRIKFLKKEYEKYANTTKSDIGKLALDLLVKGIDKRFGKMENNHFLAIATILDPRFKRVHFTDPSALTTALGHIKDAVKKDLQSRSEQNEIQSDSAADEHGKKDDDFWQFHNEIAKQQQRTNSEQYLGFHPELKLYLDLPLESKDTDPVKYWCDQKKALPHLSRVALKYVPVVATSVPSERIFSKAGTHYTEKRNRLMGHTVSKLLFLQALSKELWLL